MSAIDSQGSIGADVSHVPSSGPSDPEPPSRSEFVKTPGGSEPLNLPVSIRTQSSSQPYRSRRCRDSSKRHAQLPQGSINHARSCSPGWIVPGGDIGIRRTGTNASYVTRRRQFAPTPTPRCEYRNRFADQHPRPHIRFVGVLRAMVWNLECGGHTGWSFPALQDANPALPLEVRTQNGGYLADLDPERDGDLVGRQAGCTNPGLIRPGQQSTDGLEKGLEDRVIGRQGPDLAGLGDKNPPVGESGRRKCC